MHLGLAIVSGILLCGGCHASSTSNSPTATSNSSTASRPTAGVQQNNPPSTTVDPTVSLTPMDLAFERGLGVSRQELTSAVIDARFDYVVTCVDRLGYEASRADFPESTDPPPPPPFGGVAETALTILDSIAGGPSAPAAVPGRDEAINQCYLEAADALPDPTTAFFDWLSQAASDLAARTMADPRVVAAEASEADCLRELGIDQSPNALSDTYVERADDILSAYRNGGLALEPARAQLNELAADEGAVAPGISDCIRQRVLAQDAVYNEYEQEFVEQHAQAVAEQVAIAREGLSPYRDYLPD